MPSRFPFSFLGRRAAGQQGKGQQVESLLPWITQGLIPILNLKPEHRFRIFFPASSTLADPHKRTKFLGLGFGVRVWGV